MADGNYATAAQVIAFKVDGTVVDLSAYGTAEIENAIAIAENLIEKITNDIFYLKTETNYFDGKGMMTLFFAPEVVYPLVSVTTLKDVDIDGTVLETLVENEDFVKYDHYVEVSKGWPGDSPRRGTFRGGVFPKGQNNVEIAGTWGRSTTPPEITRATILLTLEYLISGSSGMTSVIAGVKQVSWSDFSATFTGESNVIGKDTGFAEVDRLLSGHINYVDMFMVP